MLNKSLVQKFLHTLFSFLPQKCLCVFGTCQATCGELAMENDILKLKSKKLKKHLSICKKCWNYSKQMQLVNRKIVEELKLNVELNFDESHQQKSVEDLARKFSREP